MRLCVTFCADFTAIYPNGKRSPNLVLKLSDLLFVVLNALRPLWPQNPDQVLLLFSRKHDTQHWCVSKISNAVHYPYRRTSNPAYHDILLRTGHEQCFILRSICVPDTITPIGAPYTISDEHILRPQRERS